MALRRGCGDAFGGGERAGVGQDGGAPVLRASEPERAARGGASGAARIPGQVRGEQGEGREVAMAPWSPPRPAWPHPVRPLGLPLAEVAGASREASRWRVRRRRPSSARRRDVCGRRVSRRVVSVPEHQLMSGARRTAGGRVRMPGSTRIAGVVTDETWKVLKHQHHVTCCSCGGEVGT